MWTETPDLIAEAWSPDLIAEAWSPELIAEAWSPIAAHRAQAPDVEPVADAMVLEHIGHAAERPPAPKPVPGPVPTMPDADEDVAASCAAIPRSVSGWGAEERPGYMVTRDTAYHRENETGVARARLIKLPR